MPGPSTSFIDRNGQLARQPRIVVGFRKPGSPEWDVVYSTGTAEDPNNSPARYVSQVSAIPSTFDLSSLSFRVGDATASILTKDGGPASYPEMMGQSDDSMREMSVLLGFDGMGIEDYLEVFSGHITGFPRMSPTEYQIRATDGMDLLRYLNRGIFGSVSSFDRPLKESEIAIPIEGFVPLVNAILASGLGFDADAGYQLISNEDFAKWVSFHQGTSSKIDIQLLAGLFWDKMLSGESDPKRVVESVLPSFGIFLSKYTGSKIEDPSGGPVQGGPYGLREIRPKDKMDGEAPQDVIEAVITDDDIVSISADWNRDHRIKSVKMNYGLISWDTFADIAENELEESGISLGEYANSDLGRYALSHSVDVVPYGSDQRRGTIVNGRDVEVDAIGTYMTQTDLSANDLFDSTGIDDDDRPGGWDETVLDLRPGPQKDPLLFPVRYDGFRRSWDSVDWTIPVGDPVRMPTDHVHEIHQSAARILRAGFLQSMRIQMSVQARKAAALSVGDLVLIQSSQLPDTANRGFGLDGSGEGSMAQVMSSRPNVTTGTVDIELSIPAVNPIDTQAFWTYTDEIAHSSGTPENPSQFGWFYDPLSGQGRIPDRAYSVGVPIGGRLEDEAYSDHVSHISAIYWTGYQALQPPPLVATIPRAAPNPAYEYRLDSSAFHYVRSEITANGFLNSWEPGARNFILKLRVSLLSGEKFFPVARYQEPLAVEWSEVVEVPLTFPANVPVATTTFHHSICCPEHENGADIKRPDSLLAGAVVIGYDTAIGPVPAEDEYEYTYTSQSNVNFAIDKQVVIGDTITVNYTWEDSTFPGPIKYRPRSIRGEVLEVSDETVRFRADRTHFEFDRTAPVDYSRWPRRAPNDQDAKSRWVIKYRTKRQQVSSTAGSDRPFLSIEKMKSRDGDLAGIQAYKVQLIGAYELLADGTRTDAFDKLKFDSGSPQNPIEGSTFIKVNEVQFRRLRFGPTIQEDDEGPGIGGVVLEVAQETEQL